MIKNQNHLPTTRMPDEISPYLPGGNPGGEWAEQDGIKIHQMLATVMRRRRIMLITFLGVLAIIAAYTWASKPVYKASATLLVGGNGRNSGSSNELPLLADLQELTQARSVETQTEIIRSLPILQGALERVDASYRKELGDSPDVDVKSIKGTDVIVVSTFSHSPDAAAAMSNAVCEHYVQDNQIGNREQTHAAAEYVRQQMQSVRSKLEQAQTALKSYKEQNLTVDLSAESQQRIAQLTQIEADLRHIEAERAANAAQYKMLQKSATKMASTQVASSLIAPTPTVDAIRAELTRLEIERTAALQEYTPDSPEVTRLDKQIAQTRSRLVNETKTEVRSIQTAVNPVKQSLTEEIAKTQASLWAQDARKKALASASHSVKSSLMKLPEREYRLAVLATEASVLQQTYQMLNQEYQRLRISEEARLANVRIVAPAVPPTSPIKPRKALNMVLGVIFGAMMAAGIAALVDRMDDRIHSEDDVQHWTNRPVLTHVPFIKNEAERCLVTVEKKNSPLLESFRMLRGNISLSMIDEPVKSVVVTSAEPSEGKTHASANLAIAMAMDGKRVVLVEGDLRRPSVHRLFNLSNEIGFTNVVSGKVTLEDALQESGISNLKILASGPLPPNPPELLNSRASRTALQQIIDNTDFVVVDSPPSLVMTDAQIISTVTDAAILVVSAGQSRKHLIGRVSAMLSQTGNKLLGVVINKLNSDGGGYYGYYSYSYYGYHYKYHGYDESNRELAASASKSELS